MKIYGAYRIINEAMCLIPARRFGLETLHAGFSSNLEGGDGGGYVQNWVSDHFLDLHCCTITVELKVFRNKKKLS